MWSLKVVKSVHLQLTTGCDHGANGKYHVGTSPEHNMLLSPIFTYILNCVKESQLLYEISLFNCNLETKEKLFEK